MNKLLLLIISFIFLVFSVAFDNLFAQNERIFNPERKNPITSTGHADFVKTNEGELWAVFLGCRPYEDDYYNTGRETFLAPVKWINGWPVINPGNEEVQYYYPYPIQLSEKSFLKEMNPDEISYNGNFSYRDNFNKEELNINWMFLRTPVGTTTSYAPVWITNTGMVDTIGVNLECDTSPAPEGGRVKAKWSISEGRGGRG